MTKQELWKRFTETGSVEDYLKYKRGDKKK